ncbi:MAG: OadG family protein [Bacteroidales bacterium]|nr:OadG family protein [Bacteroidales bacterium]
MKTLNKLLIAGLLSFATLTAMAAPRHHHHEAGGPDAVAGATQAQPQQEQPHAGCPMHALTPSVDFTSVKTCYAPDLGAFVAIDSVECSVHLVKIVGDSLKTVASFQTDNIHKRHDLKNILRPVSVSAMGPYVLVLASAVNDTSYVAILDGELNELARRSFNSPMYAMHREHGVLVVAGRNPYGYDINLLPLHRMDLKQFAEGDILTHHYRVAKQSEKIKESDPIGIGLTAVAVAVVFLALVCIALLISGSGKLIAKTEEKNKEKGKKERSIKPVSDGSSHDEEIYAAIGAAIYLYNEELHDEEEAVITIQKVEREWTPWNAKFYNMNQYFNNRR